MKLFSRLKSKNIFYGLFSIVIIAGLVFGIWFWRDITKRAALESRLQEIEGQISATEKRLQELSKLTPEEIAKREAELEILSAKTAIKDVHIDGVEVITTREKKVVKNLSENYSIEIPPNLLIARSISPNALELHDPEIMCQGDPLCSPILRIVVSKKDMSNIFPPSVPYETINIGGQTVYRVAEKIPFVFEGSYYYWSRNDNVYYLRVSAFNEPKYRKYIDTFRFE